MQKEKSIITITRAINKDERLEAVNDVSGVGITIY
jgi:hypothetical protein